MTNEFNDKTGELFLGGAPKEAINESNKPTEDDEVTADELEKIFAGSAIAVSENLKHPELFREEQVSRVQAAEDEQGRKGR